MVDLVCINCGGPRNKGRRLCRECYLAYKRKKAKEHFQAQGRYMYSKVCCICKKPFSAWRKNSTWCPECYRKTKKGSIATNKYEKAGGGGYCWKHRRIAEQVLGRKLSSNEVVHHIDEDPTNNSLSNLVVLSRVMHGRLHEYLRQQRALLEKSKSVNSVNCWKALIAPMTTTWLETAGVKVKKLSEMDHHKIGNQQPRLVI